MRLRPYFAAQPDRTLADAEGQELAAPPTTFMAYDLARSVPRLRTWVAKKDVAGSAEAPSTLTYAPSSGQVWIHAFKPEPTRRIRDTALCLGRLCPIDEVQSCACECEGNKVGSSVVCPRSR